MTFDECKKHIFHLYVKSTCLTIYIFFLLKIYFVEIFWHPSILLLLPMVTWNPVGPFVNISHCGKCGEKVYIITYAKFDKVILCFVFVYASSSQHRVLIPALWNTDVQEWEINCMNSLVLEEASGGQDEGKQTHTHNPTLKHLSMQGQLTTFSRFQQWIRLFSKHSPIQTCADIPAPLHKTSFFVPLVCLVYIWAHLQYSMFSHVPQ